MSNSGSLLGFAVASDFVAFTSAISLRSRPFAASRSPGVGRFRGTFKMVGLLLVFLLIKRLVQVFCSRGHAGVTLRCSENAAPLFCRVQANAQCARTEKSLPLMPSPRA